MKKTSKILSGSLLVALMAFGLVKGNPVEKTGGLQVRDVLAEDVTKDVAGRIVRKADGEAPAATGKVSEVKAQVSEEVEGKRHIRFVVGIDSYAYDGAHFDITFKNGEEVVKTWADQRVSYVYEAVEAAGETVTAADVFGEEYNYLIAFTVNNVPQANWNNTIEVNATVETAEQEYAGTVVEKSVQGIIDAEEVVVPELEVVYDTLLIGDNWDPHGVTFIHFYIANTGFHYDNVESFVSYAVKDGNKYDFKYIRNINGTDIFMQASTFVGDTAQDTYVLYFEITMKPVDGKIVVYTAEQDVVKGKKYTLSNAKSDYSGYLDNYLNQIGVTQLNYTDENWALIQSYISTGKANISNSTSIADVKTIYASTTSAIDAVEQRDLSIDEAKESAKIELNNLVSSLNSSSYTTENWESINSLLEEGKNSIDAASSEDEILSTLDSYKTAINAVPVIPDVLTLGNNWDPHGFTWLHFYWTNPGLVYSAVTNLVVYAMVDGTRHDFVYNRNINGVDIFMQAPTFPSNIQETSYTLHFHVEANIGGEKKVFEAVYSVTNGYNPTLVTE